MCRASAALLICWGAVAQADPNLSLVAPDKLTACLPRNAGVIAGRRLTGGSGFDYRMSQAIAAHVGLPLTIVWYENEQEEDSDPLKETYAMLAHGLCDMVPGHPRYGGAVGRADFTQAKLPRWLGMQQEIDPDTNALTDKLAGFVKVRPVAVTGGYMRAEIGLVYRDGTGEPMGLDDLGGRSLALQQGALSGAIAMLQLAPADRAGVATFSPGDTFLWNVESSGADLAIVDVPAFDSFRASNPFTTLKLADWRHPIGMDIGIAVLAENTTLHVALDAAIDHILSDGSVADVAKAEGLTYAAPRSETLAPLYTREMLVSTR